MENLATPEPTATFASRLYSHRPFSTASVNTVLFCGVWGLSVSQLCDVVKQHRSLRRAEILSTECYTESTGRVVHRFLVLELHREGRQDIWLRLDRRPGSSVPRLLLKAGTVPAKDTVRTAFSGDRVINISDNLFLWEGPTRRHKARSRWKCVKRESSSIRNGAYTWRTAALPEGCLRGAQGLQGLACASYVVWFLGIR